MSDNSPDPYNNPDEKPWSSAVPYDKTETILDVDPTLTERILAEFKISDYTYDKNLQNLKYKNKTLTKTKTAAKILNKIQKKYPDEYKKPQLKVKTSLLNLTAFKINQIQEHHAHNKLKIKLHEISKQNDCLNRELQAFKDEVKCGEHEGKLLEEESGIQEDGNEPYFGDAVQKSADQIQENHAYNKLKIKLHEISKQNDCLNKELQALKDEVKFGDGVQKSADDKIGYYNVNTCENDSEYVPPTPPRETTFRIAKIPKDCQHCVGWRLDSSEKNETIKNLHAMIMEKNMKLEASESWGKKLNDNLKKVSDQNLTMKGQVTSMMLNIKSQTKEVFDLKRECSKLNKLKDKLVWQILDERTHQQMPKPSVKNTDCTKQIENKAVKQDDKTEDSENLVITAKVKSENLKNENTVLEHKYLSLGSKFTELKTENEKLKTKIINHDCFWTENKKSETLDKITYEAIQKLVTEKQTELVKPLPFDEQGCDLVYTIYDKNENNFMLIYQLDLAKNFNEMSDDLENKDDDIECSVSAMKKAKLEDGSDLLMEHRKLNVADWDLKDGKKNFEIYFKLNSFNGMNSKMFKRNVLNVVNSENIFDILKISRHFKFFDCEGVLLELGKEEIGLGNLFEFWDVGGQFRELAVEKVEGLKSK